MNPRYEYYYLYVEYSFQADATIDQMAVNGWRLHTYISFGAGVKIVMEREIAAPAKWNPATTENIYNATTD